MVMTPAEKAKQSLNKETPFILARPSKDPAQLKLAPNKQPLVNRGDDATQDDDSPRLVAERAAANKMIWT